MLWDEPKIFFLERRYFFSIILSEFLKNRVALQRWLCNSVGMDTKDIAWYFENGYFANLSLDLNQKIVRRRTVSRHDPNRG